MGSGVKRHLIGVLSLLLAEHLFCFDFCSHYLKAKAAFELAILQNKILNVTHVGRQCYEFPVSSKRDKIETQY